MSAVILATSAILQFIAALFSVHLIQITGRRKAWTLIAFAMTLMGVRRSISLYHTISGDIVYSADLSAELIALTISFLMVSGVFLIGPVFKKEKSINKALKRSEERYKQLVEHANDIICEINMEGCFTYINPVATRIMGYTEEEISGKHFTEGIAQAYRRRKVLFYERQRREQIPSTYCEYPALTKEGTELWLGQNVQLIIEDGQVTGFHAVARDITERRQSENKYRTLFEKSTDAILIIEKDRFVDCNQATIKMLGYQNKEELLDTHPSQLSPQMQADGRDSFEKANEMMSIAFDQGNHRFEWDHKRKNGEVFPVEVLMTAIPFGEENVLHVVWRDISERKQAEIALRESEERWQFALEEGSQNGVWDWNIITNEVFVTKRWGEILGYEEGEIDNTQDEWNKRLHPDDKERCYTDINRHLKGETPFYKNEHRMLCKNGSYNWILDRGKIVSWTEDKKPQRMIGTYTDISEYKQAEEKLRESEERFRSAFADAAISMALVSLDHSIIEVNQAFVSMLGYSKDELVGVSFEDITHSDDVSLSLNHHQELITGKIANYQFKKRYLHKQGNVIWGLLSVSLVRDNDTTPLYAIAQIQDITKRKQVEKEIARFSQIFEDSLNEIYLFDVASLKFVQVNRAAQLNLGYTMVELQGMTPVDIKPEFTAESFRDLLAPLRTGEKESVVFEAVHQRKDRSLYDVEVHLQFLSHGDEELFVSIIMDISDKKKQEAILNQAQKMEAVGQLTGGIAHDFNNLLSIISGNLRFLREDLGETSEDIDELFEDAISAVNDGAELTQRLLAFSRIKVLHPEYKNVNNTIEKSVRFLSRTLVENTDLETVLPDETLFINVDPSQLENALLNLCINARDAMPEGGTITISAERYHHGSDATDDYNVSLPEGDYVKISVTDTGTGIDPEDMQYVYEPFYTTKDMGKGSGLGLSMVYGFTQQSQGACHIDSTPGEGTTVSMVFPEVVEQRAIDRPPEVKEELSAHDSKVILVVEDEPRVRRVTLRDLKKLGYQTLEAENADMARIIIESGEHIDLLFSDVLMPGEMDGHMLAVWTQEHYPQIKILLTSGYSKGKTETKREDKHRFPSLRKPYSSKNLARQIRTVLMNGG